LFQFFLEGVTQTAEETLQSSQAVLKLFEVDRGRIKDEGRSGASALLVFDLLQSKPVCTITQITQTVGLSHVSAGRAVSLLEKLEILHEITGRQRGRIYVYQTYLKLLSDETDIA